MIGDYVKKTWETGDVIAKEPLNNNENKTEELDLGLYAHLQDYAGYMEKQDFLSARDMARTE
jgi:hypothetical protein